MRWTTEQSQKTIPQEPQETMQWESLELGKKELHAKAYLSFPLLSFENLILSNEFSKQWPPSVVQEKPSKPTSQIRFPHSLKFSL